MATLGKINGNDCKRFARILLCKLSDISREYGIIKKIWAYRVILKEVSVSWPESVSFWQRPELKHGVSLKPDKLWAYCELEGNREIVCELDLVLFDRKMPAIEMLAGIECATCANGVLGEPTKAKDIKIRVDLAMQGSNGE